MKELTREELPTDGTHFVVTWCYKDKQWAEVGTVERGWVYLFCDKDDCFQPGNFLGGTNVRYWQFPEGETK